MKRLSIVIALIVGLMATTAVPAFAHMCENASRSANATDRIAANSKVWVRVGDHLEHWLEEDFPWVDREFGEGDATPEQIEQMVALAMARFEADHADLLDIVLHDRAMLASGLLRGVDPWDESTWPKQLSNGKGIDIRVDLYLTFVDVVLEVYEQVMSPTP